MLLVPPPVRGDPQVTLQNIRNQYDDLVRRSPTLPSKYDAVLTFEVVGRGRLPKPPKPGQIPPSNITPHTTTELRELLSSDAKNNDGGSSSSNSSTYSAVDKISHFMAQENNYDTEEDKEVKIAFDLDDNINYNAATAAFAAAELASRKEQITQNSLQAALAFEMQRLDGNTFPQPKKNNKQKISASRKKTPRMSSPLENKKTTYISSPYRNRTHSTEQEERSDIEIQIEDE